MAQSPDHAYFIGLLGDVVFASSTETVIVTGADIDGETGPVIQFVNPSVERTSGYQPEELVGHRLGMLFPRETVPHVIEILRIAAEEGRTVVVDQETRHRNGQTQWLELSTMPIFDNTGKLMHFVRIGRDITARRKAEQSRETTQRLLASVFGVINEPLAVVDHAGKLIMANTAVTRRLGWSIFDLMGKAITTLLAESDRPHLIDMMTEHAALDQTRQLKCSLLVKGKPQVLGEVEMTSLHQSDGQTYHVLTFRLKAEPEVAANAGSFEHAVRQALMKDGENAAVVAGKLQLVGLEAIRESLGEKWPALAERAHALAERTIQRHLRPGDIFRRSTDDGYLVLFSHLTATEAEFKANAIAVEIKEKLTGEMPELAEARVASFASAVVIDEKPGATEETIVEAIERRLQAERDRVEKVALATLTAGLRSMKAVSATVVTEQGAPTPITIIRLPKSLRQALQSLRSLGQIGFELETETFLLAGAAERVLAGLSQNAGEIILTQVRLATLSQHRSAEAWLNVARTLGDAAKRQIIIELCEIPGDMVQSRLTDLTMRLSSLFKSVAFELPTTETGFVANLPPTAKLTTMSYSRIPWTTTGQPAPAFCKMIKALEMRQRRLIVRDIASPAKQHALARAGVSLFVPPQE